MHFEKRLQWIQDNSRECAMTLGKDLDDTQMSALIGAIRKNTALKDFTFNPSSVQNPAQMTALLQALEEHESLENLDIDLNQPLTDDNVRALTKLIVNHPNLKILSFNRNSINDSALPNITQAIIKNRRLVQFQCNIDALSDDNQLAAMRELILNSKLKQLIFFPNTATRKQMEAIVEGLSKNQHLTYLCLGVSEYPDNGLEPLIECLSKHTHSLTELSLWTVDDVNFKQLVELMKHDKQLTKLYFEMEQPTLENLRLIEQMVRENLTLTKLDYRTLSHPLEDDPEWERIDDLIYNKIQQNKKLVSNATHSTSTLNQSNKKRPASEVIITPQADLGNLPSKKQRTMEKPTDDSISNTKYLPPRIST